jgi:hypothetical protein
MKDKLILYFATTTALIFGSALTNLVHGASLNTFSADGTLENFSNIDWHSNGAGWVRDLNLSNLAGATDNFSFTYQAFAAAVGSTSPTPNLYVAAPGPEIGTWELTTYGTINATATCLTAGDSGCSAISVNTHSGSWRIFLDNASPDADQSAGTGFLDGVNIASGSWESGASTFFYTGNPQELQMGESGTLNGTVTMTNNTYINPDLLGTSFQASLQFPGQSAPLFTRPAAFNGIASGPDSSNSFVLQTDAIQGVTQVPEPAAYVMFLAGLGLFSLIGRRARSFAGYRWLNFP